MALCKFCLKPFAWGNADGKWVPPIGEDADLVGQTIDRIRARKKARSANPAT